jgi:hypothetical protein
LGFTYYLWREENSTEAYLSYYNGTAHLDVINNASIKWDISSKIAATLLNVYICTGNDVWKFSTSNFMFTYINVTSPRPTSRMNSAIVGFNTGFFMQGGMVDLTVQSDLWLFDENKTPQWSLVHSNVVNASGHSAVISILPPTNPQSTMNNVTIYFTNLYPVNMPFYMVTYDFSGNTTYYHYNGYNSSIPLNRTGSVSSVIGNTFFYFYGEDPNPEMQTSYNDYYRFVDEKYCTGVSDCEVCVGVYECGWCNTALLNGPSCVAGNSTMIGSNRYPFPNTCGSNAYLLGGIESCPELFPSWAIALIVIGGVILVGGIVFGIMKLRSGKPGYDPV